VNENSGSEREYQIAGRDGGKGHGAFEILVNGKKLYSKFAIGDFPGE